MIEAKVGDVVIQSSFTGSRGSYWKESDRSSNIKVIRILDVKKIPRGITYETLLNTATYQKIENGSYGKGSQASDSTFYPYANAWYKQKIFESIFEDHSFISVWGNSK
jgi:hypothetical protein